VGGSISLPPVEGPVALNAVSPNCTLPSSPANPLWSSSVQALRRSESIVVSYLP
jgi:hypothetical protein